MLASSLKTRIGIHIPAADDLTDREVRCLTHGGLSIAHSVLSRRSAGDAIPVIKLTPAHPSGRLTIVADSRGKAGLATPSGEPDSLVRALLSMGQIVVGYDPLFVGESFDPSNPVARRPHTAHFETYNPALAADQMQDLATVLAWARSLPNVREVSLVARGLAGAQALLARPALDGLARTVIDLKGLPDPKSQGSVPAALDLPGVWQFGGYRAAAALTAPAPLLIYNARPAFDDTWVKASYAMQDAEHVLRLEPHSPSCEEIARWVDRGE
jgi:hypothetical protein